MIPPKFSDVGKSASDLLSKDLPLSNKLEVKTTAANGVTFTVNGSQDAKSGLINADLKTKFIEKSRGLTITENWSTSNVLSGEAELADSLLKGLKLSLSGSLVPATNQKNAKVGAEYKQDHLFANFAVDAFKGPTVSADAVLGSQGFVAGGEVAYNVSDGRVVKTGAALGYSTVDYAIALHGLANFSVFSASYYHRVAADLDVGAKAVWEKKPVTSGVALEVGMKYALDKETAVKAKVNNVGILTIGLTQVLRPGLKVSLGGQFDSVHGGENNQKLGMSLTFEA